MKLDLVRMEIESFWVVYSKHFIEFAQERHNEYLGKLLWHAVQYSKLLFHLQSLKSVQILQTTCQPLIYIYIYIYINRNII